MSHLIVHTSIMQAFHGLNLLCDYSPTSMHHCTQTISELNLFEPIRFERVDVQHGARPLDPPRYD